jgi:hypothetical protein
LARTPFCGVVGVSRTFCHQPFLKNYLGKFYR